MLNNLFKTTSQKSNLAFRAANQPFNSLLGVQRSLHTPLGTTSKKDDAFQVSSGLRYPKDCSHDAIPLFCKISALLSICGHNCTSRCRFGHKLIRKRIEFRDSHFFIFYIGSKPCR